MRSGTKSQLNSDIIMKSDKGKGFKQNEVYHNKNRYQNKYLNKLLFGRM